MSRLSQIQDQIKAEIEAVRYASVRELAKSQLELLDATNAPIESYQGLLKDVKGVYKRLKDCQY